MRRRYVAAFARDDLPRDLVMRLLAMSQQRPGWASRVKRPELVLVGDQDLPLLSVGHEGFVLGSVFDRGHTRPAQRIDADDAASIRRTGGRTLIDRYWGHYLAFFHAEDGAGPQLVRSPFGDLGCYYRQDGRIWLIASDAELLAAAGGTRPALDREALARHLATPELVTTETALCDIRELRGGSRLSLAGTKVETLLWSPWTFAGQGAGQTDAAEAEHRLRGAVGLAVKANAAAYPKLMLLQSGGLDSSIVAACLRAAACDFTGLNLVTPDLAGDERAYARRVADHLGTPLVERYRDPAGIDFTQSLAASLPRPMARAFSQETERRSQAEATATGAGAIFDGSGGDNVFCSHRSVAAVADSLLTRGLGGEALTVARSMSMLAGVGLPQVLARSARRAWLRAAAIRPQVDLRLLAPAFHATATDRPPHPWFLPPPGVLPGRALHVSLLAYAQSLVEAAGVCAPADRVSPLIAQPIAEACLSIPSGLWFARGHDRAAARQAFAGMLPPAITGRHSKGSPASFVADLLARRRVELRAFLLDGVLAGHGLLDVDALRDFLDDPLPTRSLFYTRVMTVIDAEAWARNWD